MKLTHILEAQLPKQEKVAEPDVTQIKPRLQRAGDFVWHLYKFFDMKESSAWSAKKKKKNPEYRKALRQIVAGAITSAIEKYGKTNPKWKKINVRKAVTDMVDDLYYSDPGEHPNAFFAPYDANAPEYEGYTEADWLEDYQMELDTYNQSVSRRGWNSRDDSGQYIKNHWGRKQKWSGTRSHVSPKVSKQVKQLRREVLKRVAANNDHLPQKHFFSKITKVFNPKENTRVYVPQDFEEEDDTFSEWHPIDRIEAKLDTQGNISEIKFRLHGQGTVEHKGVETWDPAKMRRFFKYYKEHADW